MGDVISTGDGVYGTCNVCWEREWLPVMPTDEMVERGAWALDHGPYAQFDEAYKRQTARAVLTSAFRKERRDA